MKTEISEIVESNISAAIDQREEYSFVPGSICQWFEGDAYMQNVYDTVKEEGYSDDEAFDATLTFFKAAEGTCIRFAE